MSACMTSLDLAELMQLEHATVLHAIERLTNKDVIRLPPREVYEEGSELGLPIEREYYIFDSAYRGDAYAVVAHLSLPCVVKLVKQWEGLEESAPVEAVQDAGDALVDLAMAYRDCARKIADLTARQVDIAEKIDDLVRDLW